MHTELSLRRVKKVVVLLLAAGVVISSAGAAASAAVGVAERQIVPPSGPQLVDYVRFSSWHTDTNPNWRSRCDDAGGQSYVKTDYNVGRPRPKYDIVVRLKNRPPDYYDSWEKYSMESDVWKTQQPLYGPGSPGREGYFALGKRGFYDEIAGTIGVEVYRMGSSEILGWSKWPFPLGCGRDYMFWFED